MKIPCKKLRENAILPTRGTALAAGVDLYALLPDGQESAAVAPQGKYLFPTGIAVEIPEGYVGLVFARSGIATKRQLAPANCVGVIDADYRGELRVFLQNNGTETQTVENGERIAQLVITPCLDIEIEETDELSETLRGAAAPARTEAEPKNRHGKNIAPHFGRTLQNAGRFFVFFHRNKDRLACTMRRTNRTTVSRSYRS